MKTLKGFMIIFLCLFLGEMIREFVNFPIPAVVYGMLILLLALLTKVIKVEDVEKVGDGLLENLAFLFLPVTAMLIDQLDILGKNILPIFVILFTSLVLTMGVTGKVVEFFQKGGEKDDKLN